MPWPIRLGGHTLDWRNSARFARSATSPLPKYKFTNHFWTALSTFGGSRLKLPCNVFPLIFLGLSFVFSLLSFGFPLHVLPCGVWIWCHFGCHFGVVLGVIWGSFLCYFGVMLGSPKPNPLKIAFLQFSHNYFENLDANLGPKLGSKLAQNLHLTSLKFRVRFRSDFGTSWARLWEPFGLKNRAQKRT